jgi:formate dehydrogenase beta subunit
MVKLTINGKVIEAKEGQTVLEAALENGIYIPNLCYHPDLSPNAACRLCIVKIDGMRGLPTSCTTQVQEGMVVTTEDEEIQDLRRNNLWLMASEIPADKLDENSEFGKVLKYVGKKEFPNVPVERHFKPVVKDPLFIRDMEKCILCGRCIKACQELRGIGAIGFTQRGIKTIVSTNYDYNMEEGDCRFCGACAEVCPTGAIIDIEEYRCDSRDPEEKKKKYVPCTEACPVHVDVPRYIRLTAEGRFQDAIEVVREKFPFPLVLGIACEHFCEQHCKRGHLDDEPIAIKNIKRFLAEVDNGRWRTKATPKTETGRKIAIIGAGPAGLTAAWYLRLKGHTVTVFDDQSEAGGTMRSGIPPYRLPREAIDWEVSQIENIGVSIKTNHKITKLDKLLEDGYEAILVAIGTMKGTKMGIEGEDDPRVLDGMTMLHKLNLGEDPDIKGKVLVVGGGNVAMDVARSSLRITGDVTLIYRRSQEQMPANPHEFHSAVAEGLKTEFLANPLRIIPQENSLKVECIRMKLGDPDSSGRRRPEPIEGSNFFIEVDRVVMAIGQVGDVPEGFAVPVTRKNYIQTEEGTFKVEGKPIYAAGDVLTGPSSIIEAIATSKKAASAIDKQLGGDGNIEIELVEKDTPSPFVGRQKDFAYLKRQPLPERRPEERVKDFRAVELGYTAGQAVEEAKRCLKCQLRLQIKENVLPPEK